jgi:cytochrome c-type biogenesis protein CcmH
MIALWLIFAVLIAIALAFILPPLLQREERTNSVQVKEANIAVYRDQMRELEADLGNGIVSKEQYQQDRDELERRLLDDVSPGGVSGAKNPKAPIAARKLAYALAVGLPAIAIVFYLKTGNQNARSAAPANADAQQSSAAAPFANQQGAMSPQQIEANVASLAKRLEQKPNDAQGWIMLARSYRELEKYQQASSAFEKATALVSNDADLWADYAYAAAMANGQKMQGKPVELVNKALKLDPGNQKALMLAGNAAFEAKNYNQAIEYWGKLLKTIPANSEVTQSLTERINEAKSLAKIGASK